MTDPETKTDTPAPASAPPPAAAPAAGKRTLLDLLPVKFVFILIAYAAPVPMLVALLQFWLDYFAGPARQNDVFVIFRQLFQGGGDPPWFLLPVALIPSFLILYIMLRSARARLLALAMLPIFGLLEAIAFLQFFLT